MLQNKYSEYKKVRTTRSMKGILRGKAFFRSGRLALKAECRLMQVKGRLWGGGSGGSFIQTEVEGECIRS